jgi:hypothetical protein
MYSFWLSNEWIGVSSCGLSAVSKPSEHANPAWHGMAWHGMAGNKARRHSWSKTANLNSAFVDLPLHCKLHPSAGLD